MSRSRIMARIRSGLKGCAAPDLPDTLPDFPRVSEGVDRFRNRLEAVSGVFLEGRDPESLHKSLERVLQESGATEIFWEDQALLDKHALPYRLRDPLAFDQGHLVYSQHFQSRVEFPLVLHARRLTRQRLAAVRLSASGARWGIAETGTVAHQVGPGRGRLLSVLAPSHVAFLSQSELLQNFAEFFQTVRPGDEGSDLTLITGPSRTADIEKTLVKGVHGPKRWYVVLTA